MKNLLLLLISLNLSFHTLLNAQVSFQKRFGTNSKAFESLSNAVTTPDGRLLLGGFTESGTQGAYDVFIQKINPDGTEAWLKTFGGPDLDVLTDLIPASGGGYLFSGYAVDPDDGSFDAILGKVNDNGDLLWWKTFGTPATEAALTLCQRTDGSIVLIGFTMGPTNQPGLFRAVFDQNGSFITAFLTPTTDDIADVKAIATSDGGYLAEIRGGNFVFGEPDALLKYGSNHTQQWSTTPNAISGQIGQTFYDIYDIVASTTGLTLALSASNGTYLVRLSNASGLVTWLNKVKDGYASNAGLQFFGDGTIGVAVLAANLLIKRITVSGATLDSVTVPAPSITGFNPDFVFPDAGNLYLFGSAGSFGQDDYAVARINLLPSPSLAWQQTFGETAVPDREVGYAITSLPDNGFVMAGTKEDANGANDIWLVKGDAQGNSIWEKTYSISDESFDTEQVGSVELDIAGNIIVFAATDNSDPRYRLLKFTPIGDLVFDKQVFIGDYTPEHFHAIPLPDGGFAACVTQDVFTSNSIPTIIRLNSNGDVLWTKVYSGEGVHDLAALPDGSLLATGYANSKPWIFKTDANGNLLWDKTYNVANFGVLNSIRVSSDGSLFAAGGSSNADETEINALVIKTNGTGDLTWLSEFSKGDDSFWLANTVLPDASGGACFFGIFLAPPANTDFFSSIFRHRLNVSQVNASGNLISEQIFGTDGTYPYGTSADICPDGEVVFCATVNSGTALEDAWVVKTDCTVSVQVIGKWLDGTLDISPNPATAGGYVSLLISLEEEKTLRVECLDIAGKKLWEKTDQAPIGEIRFECPMPNVTGIYLLKITDQHGATQTRRVVVQ